MVGFGVYMKIFNLFEYVFIFIWLVLDWIGIVMKEFDLKCIINRRSVICEYLQLLFIEDMIMELQLMEEYQGSDVIYELFFLFYCKKFVILLISCFIYYLIYVFML